MAIIPRADESQVLSAGSPVPISGTSDARLLSGATSEFSSAVMKLGSQLAAVDKESVRQRQSLEADNAASTFETDIAVVEQQLKTSAEYGSLSSSEMLKKFQNESQKLIERRMKDVPDEGNTRLIFENKARDAVKSRALKFYSDSIQEYNKVTIGKLNSFVSSRASRVSNTLDLRELEASLTETASHVMSNNILTGTEKQDYLIKAKKELFGSYINGHVQRMMTSDDYLGRDVLEKRALNILEQNWAIESGLGEVTTGVAGVFSEDEKDSFRNRITESKWKANNRQIQQINTLEAMDMRSTKDTSERTFRSLGAEISYKVKDNATLATAKARIADAVRRGDLSPEKEEQLIRMAHTAGMRKRFEQKETVDSLYRVSFAQNLLDAEDPASLVSDAYDATSKYGVSGAEAVDLMDAGDRAITAMQKNPAIRSSMRESISTFDKTLQIQGIERLPREARLEVEASVREAKRDMYNAFLTTPEFDIKTTSDNILMQKINPTLEKHRLKVQQTTSDINKELKKIGDEYSSKLKDRTLTKDDELQYKKKITDLINMKKNQGGR